MGIVKRLRRLIRRVELLNDPKHGTKREFEIASDQLAKLSAKAWKTPAGRKFLERYV